MTFLLLCFLMNVGIFSLFHLFPKYQINTLHAIIVNYIICVFTGIIFIGGYKPLLSLGLQSWMWIAMVLGCIFIGTFYLMAITTQRLGISVSSIASKMSLAIPVVFALFIFDIESKTFNFFNYLGVLAALAAIYLSSIKSNAHKEGRKELGWNWLVLPVLVFIFGGIIDTTINFANYKYLTAAEAPLFPIYIFLSAAVVGLVIIILRKARINLSSLLGGIFLGVINYFSVYFLLGALTAFDNDGAVLYPVLNMLIIIGSAAVSAVFFGEKLEPVNKLGIVISIVAIFLISHQEIIDYLNR